MDIVDGGVFRRDMSVTTRYAWNIVTNGVVVPYGPNVSPLYGVKHDFTDLASTPLAQVGVPYPVSLPVNPLSELAGDAIRSVTLEDEAIEIRKTSLVAEYCDPAYVRQSLAFHLFRKVGCRIPFHYPVRVNLNGEFYQLAFHSARFSDELIEDYYGLDPLGYGYKNSGCLTPSLKNWVTCEKKTPDDGDETSGAAMKPLKDWTTHFGSGLRMNADDQDSVTRAVVETFDLPAWINYLAAARITMECDDSWANLSTYWDRNGTGTWMPLGYDMNQSWGHIYHSQWGGAKDGLYAELDQHKAHPLFGGTRVLCYFPNGNRSHAGGRNAVVCASRRHRLAACRSRDRSRTDGDGLSPQDDD